MNTRICPQCHAPIPASAPGGLCPACVLRDAEEAPPVGRAAPSLAEIGAAFPQLEVLRLIGQGGMGFVYQARQPSLDRIVALKILAPELGRDPAFAERFAREARVLGKLSHPNIVTVFEHGQSGGYFYLLMEYIEGVNLRQAMRAGRFTPAQALAVVPGICDALQAAHAQGVWHRDIKPENILLDARGGVKIADFGIARIVGDPARDFTLTATGGALGSAAYMAPEQHERPHDVDHRADIYSLGVVIYEMLTGELPLGRFPAPSARAAVSARIDEIVFQTLEKERELRQQSAAEVKTDVTRATRAGDGNEPNRITPEQHGRALSRMALAAGAVLFGAAVIFTHGSVQGVMLTLATTLVAVGALGLAFVHGPSRLQRTDHVEGPAKITVRSLALFLGGIVAGLLGIWISHGGVIASAVAPAPNKTDQIAVPVVERYVALDPGTFIIVAGAIAASLGYAGMWYALWQMRRGFISRSWRRGLQTMVTAPLFCLAACAALYAMRQNVSAVQREARRAQEVLILTEQKTRIAAVPVEEVFRQLNAFANASNGDEFKKRIAVASFHHSSSETIAVVMEPFLGKITILKPVPRPDKRNSPLKEGSRTTLLAALEQSDASTRYRLFVFRLEQGAWRYEEDDYPLYRASCRVEFRPEKGDAQALLRTHLGENVAAPVPGMDGQFDLVDESRDPGIAAAGANGLAERAASSLAKVGLDATFKVVRKAAIPARPIYAEDAPIEKPQP